MRRIIKLLESIKWDIIAQANITSLEADRQELAS
jgi:predicted RNase H-like nuclease (RuvC/YqgF family)